MDNPNFRFVKADICDREAVDKLFEEEHPDIVVNFAAESHVDRSIENPGIFLQTNIIGTSVLMDACRKYGIQRYHQVSTDEVYGDLPLDRPDLFFTEETPIHTSSPYSSSKAAADLLVLAYHRTYGLPVTISRCSNNYGPYHFPEKLIPLMIANALADKPLPVYGEGLNVRDWLYVEDHCKAIDLIIHKGRVGEVYNVGGHNEKQNIPMFYTPHGYSFLMEDCKPMKRVFYKMVESVCAKRNCTTISCSVGEHQETLKLTKRAAYVNNGINMAELQNIMDKTEKVEHPFTVFTLGRICYQKNPTLFNEIAEKLPEIRFVWIGDGEFREELKSKNIEITGWADRATAIRYAVNADVFLLPSRWEGLPISLLESAIV